MKTLRKLAESKRWKVWTAIVWSAMAVMWTRSFFETRSLVQKGIFPEYLTQQDVRHCGVLAAAGILLAVVYWREGFLHGKKQNHQRDEK